MTDQSLDLKSETPTRKLRSPSQDAFNALLKNRAAMISGIVIILLVLTAIFADVIAPYPFDEVNFKETDSPLMTAAPDGGTYIMGTDYLGRDTLSRTIYGTRISLAVAAVAAIVSLIIGVLYGTVSGYGSARRDNLLMRIVDFLYGFPTIIFIILVGVITKSWGDQDDSGWFVNALLDLNDAMGGIFFIFVAIGLLGWIGMARIARGQTLSVKNKEYVEAARAVGSKESRIVLRHILPNILGPCIVAETLAIPGYVGLEAFLSFIGLGVNPPTPSWGIMISETVAALRTAPWEVFTPALALTLTVLAFNFFGDGLRDAFDPRLSGE